MKNNNVKKENITDNTAKKRLVCDLLRYLLVGFIATVVEYAVYSGLSFLGWHYEISTVIGYIIATFFNWLAGRILIFGTSDKPVWQEILSVYAASIIGLVLNMGIMWLAVDIIGINKFIAKIIATAIVFFYNYIVRKKIIYKNNQKAKT